MGGAAPSAPSGMDRRIQLPPRARTREAAGRLPEGCREGCADRGCDGAQPPIRRFSGSTALPGLGGRCAIPGESLHRRADGSLVLPGVTVAVRA
jgi:hypothetical protein